MTVETIIFPDLVKAVIPYLQDKLTARGKPSGVGYRLPSPLPRPFIRVQAVGGQRLDIVHRETRLLVEVFHSSEPAAAGLAELAAAILEAAGRAQEPISIDPMVWMSAGPDDFSVPVNFFDPVSGSPRYQFYCNPILTGSAI